MKTFFSFYSLTDMLLLAGYLFGILAFCLLPVYIMRRKRSEVVATGGAIMFFFFLNLPFLFDRMGAYHDTRQLEYILLFVKQWCYSHVAIGWEPYINAGEPLYLLSNYFLRAGWFVFCLINKIVCIDPPFALFDLFWSFHFINFCIGALLFFLVLYDDFKTAFFCFISLLFSGMFIETLSQPKGLVILYYLPYIMTCLLLAHKKHRLSGFVCAVIFFAIALNYYIPHYLIICLAVFLFFIALFYGRGALQTLYSFFKKYRAAVAGTVLLAAVITAPAVFTYLEVRDYTSPTRNGTITGEVASDYSGIKSPLWGYATLFEQHLPYHRGVRHSFYFGILPLIFIPIALIRARRIKWVWIITGSAVTLYFFGLGNDFLGHRLLIRYVPSFNLIRQHFGFSYFVNFFLLCLAGYGLKELFKDPAGKDHEADEALITYAAFGIMIMIAFGLVKISLHKNTVLIFGLLGTALIRTGVHIKYLAPGKKKNMFRAVMWGSLCCVAGCDLFLSSLAGYTRIIRDALPRRELAPFVYPMDRTVIPPYPYPVPVPVDFSPIIHKIASFTHPDEKFILLRDKRIQTMIDVFAKLPKEDYAFAVSPLVYFTPTARIVPGNAASKDLLRAVFADTAAHENDNNYAVFFSEKDIDFKAPRVLPSGGTPEITHIPTHNANRLKLSASFPQDGFLVRRESFHPGWKALIDGKSARIYRANYGFQAIRVPEGKHTITFRFSSPYPYLLYAHLAGVLLNWFFFAFVFLRRSSR